MALLSGSSIHTSKYSCSEMLLSAGCWQNLPAEKEVITSWTQMVFRLCTGNHRVSEPYHTV